MVLNEPPAPLGIARGDECGCRVREERGVSEKVSIIIIERGGVRVIWVLKVIGAKAEQRRRK